MNCRGFLVLTTTKRILYNDKKDTIQRQKGYYTTTKRILYNDKKDTIQRQKGYFLLLRKVVIVSENKEILVEL